VRIDGFTSPNIPIAPPAQPAVAPAQTFTAQQTSAQQAALLALQLEEQKGGGGGGGGGHGGGHGAKKVALETIDDIAARASLNIESRKKTMLDRMNDIDRMKAELAAQDALVGEKDPDAEQQQQDGQPDPQDEDGALA
jgi:hypothetical protein